MAQYPELTVDQVGEGRMRALENARSLVQDSRVLLGGRCYARALFLAQIAGEEVGKYLLLSGATYQLIAGELKWSSFWKSFRSHAHKLECVMWAEIVLTPATNDDEKQRDLGRMKDAARELERGKLMSLYADFIEGEFRIPANLISESMARNAVAWAEGRIAMSDRIEETYHSKPPETWTPAEIEKLKTAFAKMSEGNEAD